MRKSGHNAPIVLCIYNRAEHTGRTLESLIANPGFSKSNLYIFADGPRDREDGYAARRLLHAA